MNRASRAGWILSALLALAAAGAGAWGFVEHRRVASLEFAERRAALLESENDSLRVLIAARDKTASRAEEIAARKPIEQAVQKIRGLDFKQPVVYDVLTHDGIKKVLDEKLSQQYSDRDFIDYAEGLAAFGLVPRDYPLKQKLIALLGEQVAAFYDQHQHRLFMFEDASLQKTQNRIVLAHELTHALQDQHFGLLKMPLEVKDNDDLVFATSALIEGDATVTMSDYMMQNFSLKALRENLSGMFTANMEQLQKAPRYLREALVFPYLRGQEFCQALMERGGYDGITAAFKDPPVSTAQILHPEKYFAHEKPQAIAWPQTTVLGQKPVYDNVLGELGTRILLSQWVDDVTGGEAAAGWRADRYFAYDEGNALAWDTMWAGDAAAAKFREALLKYIAKRFPNAAFTTVDAAHVTFTSPTGSGTVTTNAKPGINEIVFVWAAKKEWAEALADTFKPA